jgi:hypothetical protein
MAKATNDLVHGVPKYHINRRMVDPPKSGEPKFALFSYIENTQMEDFINSIKSTLTDEQRERLISLQSTQCKGVAKIRGAYMTQQEAEVRAEEIVRYVDSSNSIFTCIIGVPFPLVSKGMSEELNEVDLKNQTESTIAKNVRNQRLKEQKEIEEIKQREDELMRNAEKDPNADDQDNYIAQRVKLAHLRYSIEQHVKRHSECIENEKQCVKWLLDMKSRKPEFEETYMEKYLAGRKSAHIPDDVEPEGFMKYMGNSLQSNPLQSNLN